MSRPRAEPHLTSRWTPRHVWTLHRVPGRLDGPVLAARRRVLSDDEDILRFETPGGDASVWIDEFASKGIARSWGSWRGEDRAVPPGSFAGLDLAIDIYDHEPTAEERADWLRRRRLEQAILRDPPTHVWVALRGRAGGPDRAVRCAARREREHYFNAARFALEVYLPGYRDPKPLQEIRNRVVVDLMRLAVEGEVPCAEAGGARRVYLRLPTREQLARAGEERAAQEREKEEATRRAEATVRTMRAAWAAPDGAVWAPRALPGVR